MAKTEGAEPKAASPERVAAFRTGISAESRAAAYLMAKGYRILARRYHPAWRDRHRGAPPQPDRLRRGQGPHYAG